MSLLFNGFKALLSLKNNAHQQIKNWWNRAKQSSNIYKVFGILNKKGTREMTVKTFKLGIVGRWIGICYVYAHKRLGFGLWFFVVEFDLRKAQEK